MKNLSKPVERAKKFVERIFMKLSILTATYNRADYLEKLYKSILDNIETSNLKTEWIIINDGSTDNTEEVIEKFVLENKIEIKYLFQENSGKMVAINRGMEEVTGELVVDCDSDDFFAINAFKVIEQNASKLSDNERIYALCFLKQDLFGNVSGKKFTTDYMESTMFDLYFKQNIQGEKILVFNTKIRKKFKHELEENEKFITEARMYHKMDENHKILCINEAIEIGDYKEDGYTKNIIKTFKTNPNGYYNYFKEILQKDMRGVLFKKKLYILKHLIYFYILKTLK